MARFRILSPSLVALLPCVAFTLACDDDNSASTADDAGADAAASPAPHTHMDSSDGGPGQSGPDAGPEDVCAAIANACAGKDDVDGLGNLCLRVSDGADGESCGAVRSSCLTYCTSGETPEREGGEPSVEMCKEMGDVCHDYDRGPGLGRLCHDVGHKANLTWCAAIYDSCAALCRIDDGDGGTDHQSGGEHSHADPDAADATGETTPFTLKFAAKVGEREFACGERYTGVGSAPVTVTPVDLRLFVSNIHLVTATGERIPLTIEDRAPFQAEAVALLDFEDGSGECRGGTAGLNSQVTGTAPQGDYVGVTFSTSVPLPVNHQDPATLSEPLAQSPMAWNWLFGYKFVKAELVEVLPPASDDTTDDTADTAAGDAGSGGETTESPTASGSAILHLGSTACQNVGEAALQSTVECANPNRNEVALNAFDPVTDTIVLDVAQLFAGADLSGMVMCHSSGQACAPMFTSLGIDLATGAALGEQTVFHVE